MHLFYNCNNNFKNNQNILSNTFLINFKDIEKDMSNLNHNNEKFFEQIHSICTKHLKNYYCSLKDYFPNAYSSNSLDTLHSLENTFSHYLLENVKLSIYLSYKNTDKTLSFNKSVYNYFYTTHLNLNDPKILVPNLRTKLKKIKESDSDYPLFKNLIFYKKEPSYIETPFFKKRYSKKESYEINENLSTIFIHAIKYWNKCNYCDCFYKTNSYKHLEEFFNSFLKTNPELFSFFLFQRIFNIQNIFDTYFTIKLGLTDISEYEYKHIVNSLLPILYLPNALDNRAILNILIQLYKNFYIVYNFKEFSDGVKQLCLDFSFYFIPLYNMLFTNIIDLYCYRNNYIRNNICSNLDNSFDINLYKKDFENLYNTNIIPGKKSLNLNEDFKNIFLFFSYNFDFKLLDNYFSLTSIFNFNKNIKDIVDISDVNEICKYQSNFKNFILSILNSKNIDLKSQYN